MRLLFLHLTLRLASDCSWRLCLNRCDAWKAMCWSVVKFWLCDVQVRPWFPILHPGPHHPCSSLCHHAPRGCCTPKLISSKWTKHPCVYPCIHMLANTSLCAYIPNRPTQVHACAVTHIHMHACTHVRTHTHVHACTRVYIFTHTHTHKPHWSWFILLACVPQACLSVSPLPLHSVTRTVTLWTLLLVSALENADLNSSVFSCITSHRVHERRLNKDLLHLHHSCLSTK